MVHHQPLEITFVVHSPEFISASVYSPWTRLLWVSQKRFNSLYSGKPSMPPVSPKKTQFSIANIYPWLWVEANEDRSRLQTPVYGQARVIDVTHFEVFIHAKSPSMLRTIPQCLISSVQKQNSCDVLLLWCLHVPQIFYFKSITTVICVSLAKPTTQKLHGVILCKCTW